MANKHAKYELKYASRQKAATEERNAKLEELRLQIELARLNAQIAGISPAASQPVISASTPLTPSPTMRPVLGSYNSQDMIFGSHVGDVGSPLSPFGNEENISIDLKSIGNFVIS
ncbi:hypothetical protein H0H81_002123 [Sphagnurus paluster]|uniref:Uncharacterized protein n=1 Tax=Sphagnurus paluster TaxID=117069 RepID=A0A9P7KN23_9AGAR|nr:hypothetical protein H0H81_002123 [Sphagnurus paluster]